MANRKSHHTNMVIRRATGDDMDAIANSHMAAWQTAYRGIRAEDDMAACGQTEAALWVFRDNTAARRFYDAQGWEPTAAEKHEELWGTPLGEVQYRKRLSGGRELPSPHRPDVRQNDNRPP